MTESTRTPRDAWAFMRAGNDRFVKGTPAHPNQDMNHRDSVADGQTSYAALFGCSDSRLGAEIIFDVGLGELFVVRNAGQTISQSVVGSLEYAVASLKVRLILVLAHDRCGAVKIAIDSRRSDAAKLPANIKALTDTIQPAVDRVLRKNGNSSIDVIDIDEVGEEHLRDTIAELLGTSELIAEAIATGDLAIVGATYNLREGHVIPSVVLGDIE